MRLYENEAVKFLNLPAIPKKKWDGKSSFNKGLAIVNIDIDVEACAIATFDAEEDAKPRVIKVFGYEQFKDIKDIYVIPDYMETDMEDADLDAESKEKAQSIIDEANEIQNDAELQEEVHDEESEEEPKVNPYIFDHITNDEEAIAFIKAYNERNKIVGQLPRKHETILMRLAVIHADINKKKGN